MAEEEEYNLEHESEERVSRSTIDVEGFCHEHIVCKRCNNVCVDPVVLKCLHTYCLKCLPKGQNDNEEEEEQDGEGEGGEGEGEEGEGGGEEGEEGEGGVRVVEVVLEEDDGQADSGEGQAQQRQGISRNDEEAEIQSDDDHDDKDYVDVRKKEASVQEESCVPHIVYGNENLSCPHDCDVGVQIGDDIQQLVNRPLSNIIQAAKLKEKLLQGEIQCKSCEKDVARWICNDPKCSNKPLCEFCYQAHIRLVETCNHEVVEIDPEKDWWRIVHRHTWYCSEHPEHLVDMYCATDDEVMCLRCCVKDHHKNECNVSDVENLYDYTVAATIDGIEKVEELNDVFKAAIRMGESVKSSLDAKCKNVIEALEDDYQRIIQQLTNERDQAIIVTQLICDLKKEEIDDHQKTLKRVTETLEESLSFVKDYAEIASKTEFMFLKTQLNQRLDDLHERYSKFDLSPADDDKVSYRSSNETLPPIMLGEVFSTPCVKKFVVKEQVEKLDANIVITVECRDIADGHVSLRVLPELRAVVTKPGGSVSDGLACEVKCDRSNGRYAIVVPPSRDRKVVHIYHPRPYPHNQYYIKGGPISLDDSKNVVAPTRLLINL